MKIIEEIKSLNLPRGEYIVVGSGIMSVYGIREHKDIDLLVSKRLYEQLKSLGWEAKNLEGKFEYVSKGIVGASPEIITLPNYKPTLEELLSKAVIIDSVAFTSFRDLIEFKQALGREKDLIDIDLIEKYLK